MVLVDIHCHILPGIDDGSKDWDTSIKLAKAAVKDGVTHAICTPHTLNGRYTNHKDDVVWLTDLYQQKLDEAKIPLTVFPGQEVRLSGDLIDALDNDDILFCDEDGTYMLLEFPSEDVPTYAQDTIFKIMQRGVTPIIVHPERNSRILKEPEILQGMLEQGCLVQITASSYTGIFGKKIEEMSRKLIAAGQGCTFASDAHDLPRRQYQLSEAYKKMSQEFSQDLAQQWQDNARSIINGDPVQMDWHPLKQKKKFWLF